MSLGADESARGDGRRPVRVKLIRRALKWYRSFRDRGVLFDMSTPIRTHRDLLIWQKGMALVDLVERLVATLPESELRLLADQLVRAVRSVPANIAEGHGRHTPAEFARFLTIAHASLSDVDTHLEIARRRGYLDEPSWANLDASVQELGRMIRSFRAALRRR